MTHVRKSPKPTLKPVVRIKWRWKDARKGLTHRGRRYFLFGVVPIWTVKDAVSG